MKKTAKFAIAGSALVLGTATFCYRNARSNKGKQSVYISNDSGIYAVQTLNEATRDMDYEQKASMLYKLQKELENEWGPFGPADMDEMYCMLENAGNMIYVIRPYENRALQEPLGVLQTAVDDLSGDYRKLLEKYPTFNDITNNGTWKKSSCPRGNTALLLQITTFDRNKGIGSLLRDTVLGMLPESTKYALTTTPVDDTFSAKILEIPEMYTPSMNFHYRGGAEPVGFQFDYKIPDEARPNIGRGQHHGPNVVFMKYIRRNGTWKNSRRELTKTFSYQ